MSAVKYRVTFDRIGRNRDVAPLTVEASCPDDLAEAVYRYARPRLLSRDVEVIVSADAGSGQILCGFQNGGTFTVEEYGPLTDATPGGTE